MNAHDSFTPINMFQAHHAITSQPQLSPSSHAVVGMPSRNNVVTTSPIAEQKPRKLRASCDACSRAKVKCDKVRPTCHRCGNMGICCNYSPSMRLGKPRKHRNPDGTIKRDGSPASSCSGLAHRSDLIPRTSSHTAESSPEPSDPFFFGPATPEYHFQDAYMPATVAFDGSRSPYSDAGSFASTGTGTDPRSSWSGDDHILFHSPSEVFAPVPQFPASQPAFASHHRSTSVHSQPEMFTPMEGLHSSPMATPPGYVGMNQQQSLPVFAPDKMAMSPPPMVAIPLPTPPASATVKNHDCTQFAFQTLNNLYTPPSGNEDLSATGSRPSLDSIIATNKAAVDKLFVLLSCSCSVNPHFSTTIAFTVMKILSWYQVISGGDPTQDSDVILTPPLDCALSTSPVLLGELGGLNAGEEQTYRTQLVLGELRKLEKLIDRFSERYCKSSVVAADMGIEGGVYSALEALLRTRVRDTFKVTMRSAPEEVKRQVASRTHNRLRTYTM